MLISLTETGTMPEKRRRREENEHARKKQKPQRLQL